MRAAAWRLYFPEVEHNSFRQHKVPLALFFSLGGAQLHGRHH